MTKKYCDKCKQEKKINYFFMGNASFDGTMIFELCKDCEKEFKEKKFLEIMKSWLEVKK